jgi:hypothetical protein
VAHVAPNELPFTEATMRILATGISCLFAVGAMCPVPAQAQLNQITSCHELSSAVLNVSRRRAGTGVNCNRQAAINQGRSRSRVNARDAIDQICISNISAARAAATCAAAGKSVPSTSSTSLTGTPVPAPGRPAIDAQMAIQGQTRACVVLRDLPSETETRTRENFWCWFDNQRETVATVRSRARCGVQCFP